MRLLILLITAAVLLAGCTPPITEQTLAGIGTRTDAVSEALKSPARVQRKMLAETAENGRVCRYLSGNRAELLSAPVDTTPTLTARQMEAVADVVGAYARSLRDAAGGGSIATLQKAAAQFKSKANAQAASVGGVSVAPIAAAGVNIVLRVGEAARNKRIRAIMEDVYPSLVQLERRLVSDAPSVVRQNRSLVGGWERQTRCILARVRDDSEIAINYFDQFRKDRAEIERDVTLAEKAPAAVRALFEAHILAITEPPDAAVTVRALQAIYKDIDAITAGG